MNSTDELKKKLREKVNQSKLKRSTTDSKRSFLEKAKVPENMMEQCMKAMNHTTGANVLQMMNQLQKLKPTIDMVQEQVPTQAPQQAPQQAESKPNLENLVATMPETARALANALSGKI